MGPLGLLLVGELWLLELGVAIMMGQVRMLQYYVEAAIPTCLVQVATPE